MEKTAVKTTGNGVNLFTFAWINHKTDTEMIAVNLNITSLIIKSQLVAQQVLYM